jgi:hypothetical protein
LLFIPTAKGNEESKTSVDGRAYAIFTKYRTGAGHNPRGQGKLFYLFFELLFAGIAFRVGVVASSPYEGKQALYFFSYQHRFWTRHHQQATDNAV